MTAEERKAARLKRLVSEINEDLLAVTQITGRAKALLTGMNAKSGPVPDCDLMAMSGYLHHFYTGIEAIFERISRNIDGGPGKTGDWYRELLRSMTLELPKLRPRVISPELMEELDEYRRFRHLFRHVYAGELRRMGQLRASFHAWMAEYDALLTPTLASAAIPVTEVDETSPAISLMTRPGNYLGLCGLSMPAGFSVGLPVGVQILGRPYAEGKVLKIGKAFQDATDFHKKAPDLKELGL